MASAFYAFLAYVVGAIVFFTKPCDAADTYFVFTQPGTGSILYIRQGETVVRTLMMGGHMALGAIALNQNTGQLYVADPPLGTVYWYQLIVLPGKQLITDGRKHVAVNGFASIQSLAVDPAGDLYISGQALTDVTPSAPPPPYAMQVISNFQLTVADPKLYVVEGVHNKANTGDPPKFFDPVAMFSDGSTVYWANGHQGGSHGTIVKGGKGGGGVSTVIDQGESATAVGHNGEYLFYSTENGIFGASLNKKEAGCGAPAPPPPAKFNPVKAALNRESGPCKLISSELRNTKGMWYDGDGSMFTMDPNSGIYSFPSGNLEPHRVTQVAKASGLVDLTVLFVPDKSFACMAMVPSVVLLVIMYLGTASL